MQQFRDRGGMAYDFSVDGAHFTVRVFARANPDDPSDWRVELCSGRLEQARAVTAWGATRADALRAAGQSWTDQPVSEHPRPDWDEVAKALVTVRAL